MKLSIIRVAMRRAVSVHDLSPETIPTDDRWLLALRALAEEALFFKQRGNFDLLYHKCLDTWRRFRLMMFRFEKFHVRFVIILCISGLKLFFFFMESAVSQSVD